MKYGEANKNESGLAYIQNEFIANKNECNCLKTDNNKIIDSLKTITVWCARTPHVYPFSRISKKYKYKDGLLKYKQAIFECVSEVFFHYLNNAEMKYEEFLEVTPDFKVIFKAIEIWIVNKREKDEEIFDLMSQMDFHTYLISSSKDKEAVDYALNTISALIRKKLLNNGHREKVHNFKKNSKKSYKNFMKVCEQAWSKHRAILLLRLDWGYKVKVPDLRAVFDSEDDFENRFKVVSNYRAMMLKYLKNRFKDDLIFFAWKIECAPIKGLHIHWLLGINGSKHQDRINVPRGIADAWNEIVDDEDAYVWNLSAEQKEEDAILRVIKYDDPKLWEIVGGYVDYLTKIDYMVRMKTPKKMHSFGSTKFIKEKKKKTGPKRLRDMKDLDSILVRRPLSEMKR